MFTQGTVTVVTAATGHRNLAKCIASVQNQTYSQVEHWIVIDGTEFEAACRSLIAKVNVSNPKAKPLHVLVLPHGTGRDKWCGHRIYGAASFLVDSQFISFLDEDNWFQPDHIQSLMDAIQSTRASWAFSLRNIVDDEGNIIVPDRCESLGNLHHVYANPGDHLIDTSCYLLPRELAVQFSPIWYGPTRPSQVQLERDRTFCRTLLEQSPQVACNLKHTLNYTVANRGDSAIAEFFIRGNQMMQAKYPKGLPW